MVISAELFVVTETLCELAKVFDQLRVTEAPVTVSRVTTGSRSKLVA